MTTIIKEIDHPREVDGVSIIIRQYMWIDGAVTYYAMDADGDELQDEDFDHMPTDPEIKALDKFRYAKLSAGHEHHYSSPVIGCTHCEAIDPGTWRELYNERNES